MKTTSGQIDKDMTTLKDDLRRLGGDFVALAGRLRSHRRDRTMRSRERLQNKMAEIGHRARGRFVDTSEALKDQGHEAMDRWRGGVGHRPFTAIAVAFAAGLILASVLDRVYSRH